ncbi:hypothetical protein K439DRAFT_1629802 [Ramaria rubella]|nr:hypothetical protein K439DRAFT_1629802 [Ramaria rubella]
MFSTTSVLSVLFVLAPACVRAVNDWSVPCVSGSCSWDTGDGKTTAYSSMAIGGPNNLISDITPAAGWNVKGCDSNWANGTQAVQMTCSGLVNQTVYCGHVYEGGAVNTIVRLPENCGKGPFARIVTAANQTDSIAQRASTPNSNATIKGTHSLTLDYNFSQIPTSRGKITFAVTSTNLAGQPGVSKRDLNALRGRGRAGELHRRRFASSKRRSVSNFVNDAASAVTSAAGSAASAIGNAVSSVNNVDQTLNSGQLTPVNFDQDVTLFDQSISCSSGDVSGSAELKIDVDGKVDATVSFGVTVVGTIVPPQLTDFTVTADLGGSTSATFNVDATAEGSFDTGSVSLFKTGLPGLSIPSVITLGPEFSINGQVTIDLKAEAKMAIVAAWDFPSIKLVFPQENGASSGDATVSGTDNPLQLSADPSVDVSGTVTAHIIPRIDFGIDLFSGSDQASVFIDADISASLNLDVTAQATLNNTDSTNTTTSATTSATAANATSTASDATTTSANATSTASDTSITSSANVTTTALDSTQTDVNSTTTTSADPSQTSDGSNSTDSSQNSDNSNSTDTTTASDPFQTSADSAANATSADADSITSANATDTDASSTDSAEASSTDSSDASTDTATATTAAQTSATTTDDGDDTPTSTTDDSSATSTDNGTPTDTTDATEPTTTDDATDGADDTGTDTTDDSEADTTDSSSANAGSSDDTAAVDEGSNGDDTSDASTDDSANSTDDASLTDDGSDDGASTDDGADNGSDDGADDGSDDDGADESDDSADESDTADDGSDDTADDGSDDTADDGSDDTADDGSDDTADDGSDDSEDDDSDDSDDSDFRKRSFLFLGGRDTSDSLDGCVTLSGAIAINGGLQGSLAPFFDKEETFPIFSQNVQLFQKCLNGPPAGGDGATKRRRRLRRSKVMPREGDTSGLQCPTNLVSTLTSLF